MKIASRATLLLLLSAALSLTTRAASATVVPAPCEPSPSADAAISLSADATISLPADATISLPADATISLPADATISLPADATISLPADAAISIPADATISLPPDAAISLPADATISLPADATTPPSAEEILKQACAEAAASHKKVMVIFHASWCSWCHKLDTMMASPECKPLFDQSFVVCHLDIAESPDKLALENPGAEELYAKYANQNCGIPFYLIMNPDGVVIADSRIKSRGVAPTGKGDNTGYPGSKPEMEYFLRTLRETTSLTPAQLKIIKEKFTKK